MVDGLAADYIAQVDWTYRQAVVHPIASRRQGWRRELALASREKPPRTGRRWWASLVPSARRTDGAPLGRSGAA